MKTWNIKRKPKHTSKCKWKKRYFGGVFEFEYDRLFVVNTLNKSNLMIVCNWKNYNKNI